MSDLTTFMSFAAWALTERTATDATRSRGTPSESRTTEKNVDNGTEAESNTIATENDEDNFIFYTRM